MNRHVLPPRRPSLKVRLAYELERPAVKGTLRVIAWLVVACFGVFTCWLWIVAAAAIADAIGTR